MAICFLDRVEALASSIQSRWAGAGHSRESFNDLAIEGLHRSDIFGKITPESFISEISRSSELLPSGGNLPGRANIRFLLYRDPHRRFTIDALLWFGRSTSVHSHPFTGVIGNLAGDSLEVRYDFQSERTPYPGVVWGQLREAAFQSIVPGHILVIPTEVDSIHRVFHLSQSNLSLRVRPTSNDPEILSGDFAYGGLRLDCAGEELASGLHHLSFYRFLAKTDPDAAVRYRDALVLGSDPRLALFHLFLLFEGDQKAELLDRFLRYWEPTLGEEIKRIPVILEGRRRMAQFQMNERLSEGPALLLSLLQTDASRAMIHSLLARYTDGQPLSQAIRRWILKIAWEQGPGTAELAAAYFGLACPSNDQALVASWKLDRIRDTSAGAAL